MIKIIVGVVALILLVGLFLMMRDDTAEVVVQVPATATSTRVSTGTTPVATSTPREVPVVVGADKSVNLSSQNLDEVPMAVFADVTIETLDLSNNNLGNALPAEVRLLQNLKVLNLSDNKFTGVPAEIGQLKKLEELDLSNNQITGLPLELGNLTGLKVLNLEGNDYSQADLDTIKKSLPATVQILVD